MADRLSVFCSHGDGEGSGDGREGLSFGLKMICKLELKSGPLFAGMSSVPPLNAHYVLCFRNSAGALLFNYPMSDVMWVALALT